MVDLVDLDVAHFRADRGLDIVALGGAAGQVPADHLVERTIGHLKHHALRVLVGAGGRIHTGAVQVDASDRDGVGGARVQGDDLILRDRGPLGPERVDVAGEGGARVRRSAVIAGGADRDVDGGQVVDTADVIGVVVA